MNKKFPGLAHYIIWTENKLKELAGQGWNTKGWRVAWMEKGSTTKCGRCVCHKKLIELNHDYFQLTQDHNVLLNTCRHEIAHALDYFIRGKSNHDEHWRKIALSLGCDGKRCNSDAVMPTKKTRGNSFLVPEFTVD